MQTKMGMQNDKIVNRKRGQGRHFPSGIFVNNGEGRGVLVITPLFYSFFARPAGASHGRASVVPR